jgi:site-specific recombinase XerD
MMEPHVPDRPPSPVGLEALDEFQTWARNAVGFAPATISGYVRWIHLFVEGRKIEDFSLVTLRDGDAFVGRLGIRGLSENSRIAAVNALRTFFRFLYERGHVTVNPMRDLQGPLRRERHRLAVFSGEEVKALIFGYRPPALVRAKGESVRMFERRRRVAAVKPVRDSALLAVAYSCGLRVSEPGALRLEDISLDEKPTIALREFKWSREPVTFRLEGTVAELLRTYLQRLPVLGLDEKLFIFPSLSIGTGTPTRGLSPGQCSVVLSDRIANVGIEPKGRRLSFHALRYTLATSLYEHGMRIYEIQAFMRHRSPLTTARYIRLGSWRSSQRIALRALPWAPKVLRELPSRHDPGDLLVQ